MKIYIAASFDDRLAMQPLAKALEDDGHQITSSWIYQEDPNANKDPKNAAKFAYRDAAEVEAADVFIIYTPTPSTGGGRHVELGLAIAWKKEIFLVGPRENIFYHHPIVGKATTLEEVQRLLRTSVPHVPGTPDEPGRSTNSV